jgi:hypothetical protein
VIDLIETRKRLMVRAVAEFRKNMRLLIETIPLKQRQGFLDKMLAEIRQHKEKRAERRRLKPGRVISFSPPATPKLKRDFNGGDSNE